MAPEQRSWWFWAGCAAAGACTYYVLRPKQRSGADDTDFAGFLADPSTLAAPRARVPPPPRRDETGFDAFLRVTPAAAPLDPTGFDSFLRAKPAAPGAPLAAAGAAAAKQQQQEEEPLPLDRAGVLVMYGTEYGFSKEIAEKLVGRLKGGDAFWPKLVNMADHPEGYPLAAEQAVLMVCSTQGDGVPPTEAREFCDWVFAQKAGPLAGVNFSVLALGDTSYPHFCRCGKQLDAALEAAGAARAAARVDVDKEDWAAVDGWMESVEAALPGLGLRSLSETGAGAGAAPAAPAAAAKRYSKARPYFARVAALEGLCSIKDKKSDKDTVRVELDLGNSGLTYSPGDALGVYPTNDPKAVDQLLSVLGASGDELVPVPSWHYQEPEGHSTAVKAADGTSQMRLRDALSRCYDLRSPRGAALAEALLAALSAAGKGANGSAVEVAADATANGGSAVANGANGAANGSASNGAAANGKAGLDRKRSGKKVAAPAGLFGGDGAAQAAELARLAGDKGALEAYLAPRHVVDVVADFSAARLGYQQVLPALRQLQPRLYSISSSPLEAAARVQATIAVVRYESLGADRAGVCSTFVAERSRVGAYAPVFISKNPDFRLPSDPATPIIMVGPGTGLAPFRAFIMHRLLETGADPAALGKRGGRGKKSSGGGAGGSPDGSSGGGGGAAAALGLGPMVLYFGCRRRDQDYLYGSDLERWAAAGAVELHTAFSREPGSPKVYVQQRLRETADRVWELLQAGGYFYVCGDANSMAGAVEEALLEIIADRLPAEDAAAAGGAAAAAKAYLQRLADSHRYERDVWFG